MLCYVLAVPWHGTAIPLKDLLLHLLQMLV